MISKRGIYYVHIGLHAYRNRWHKWGMVLGGSSIGSTAARDDPKNEIFRDLREKEKVAWTLRRIHNT